MRLLTLVATELRHTRANVAYMGLTVIAPIAFMALFVFLLGGDITSPVGAHPGPDRSGFAQVMDTNRAPGNVPYFAVTPQPDSPPAGEDPNLVVLTTEPAAHDGRVTGELTHWFNDVNTNMTKNYRNRVTSAVYAWSGDNLDGADVTVREHRAYADDIPWSNALGVAVFGLGVLFSGLLFGMLSMTQEWENGTIVWLRLAPGRAMVVVAAKLIGAVLKCTVAALLLVGALWLFTGALPGRPLSLAAALAVGYLGAAAVGILVGFVSRNTLTSLMAALVIAVICWVGGGGLGPMFAFGERAVTLSQVNPTTHLIDLVRWSYFGGIFHPTRAVGLLAGFTALSIVAVLLIYSARINAHATSSEVTR